MIFDDETNPLTKKSQPRVLDKFSITELDEYIAHLHAEIIRAEAEKTKKEKLKATAEAVFKS